ncbi:hypothetical protein H5410_009192 [Solanum commersonii]|uniref:At2g35280-like TPR domain-containing protein n=1 Tax=Solanum commersonii TaxID=4109 RepID=A0A9J6AH59_SOLCO|nr:hypothetical protein H5410_009192 [Solanum commersonii]
MKKICASIESFEKVILLDIVERVAYGSFKDLINLRLSEERIYEKVSIADFPLFSWSVRTRDQIDMRVCFVNRCMKASNREALYKIDDGFFKNNFPELALQRLREAKKGRHNGTTYVLAIISIFAGGGDTAAVRFIGHMKEKLPQRKEIKQWRKSLINMIDNVCDDEQDDQPCYGCGCDDEVDHVFALLPKFEF